MPVRLHTISVLLALSGALLSSCGKPDPVEPEVKDTRHLSFPKEQIDVDYRETAFSVQVDANFDYRVDIQADWIVSDPDRASTSATQYFIARKNNVAYDGTANETVLNALKVR